ncbi:MAG TPA: EscD/YscD/HrpQ family type III secretion system inner membrane ring protein [Thiothrix sp.]|nr:EscD/YscD/HrpQ family type III secretion system inner membrane ring protein [Thiothrix sp.]
MSTMSDDQQTSLHLLRILSGPNTGARTLLKVGEYIVGSGVDCDIILQDDYIAQRHLKIIVNDRHITLQPLVQPVYVDSKDIGKNEYKIKHYQVITLGNVHFAIGSVKKPWPSIKNPNSHKDRKTKQKIYSKKKTTPKKGLGWLNTLILGAGLLLLANIVYFKPDVNQVLSQLGFNKAPEQNVQQTIDDLNLDNIRTEKQENGALRVTGYVKTHKEEQLLLDKLAGLDKPVTHRIWVDEQLLEHANYIATTFDETDIRFTMPKSGLLNASGFVKNSENWKKARQSILSDVDGIANINDKKVNSLAQQQQQLKASIAQENFADRMTLRVEGGVIVVDGELTNAEISRWNSIKNEFNNTHGNLPEFLENLQSPRSRFNLAIKSVSVGKVPFITSKDDKKYMIGSHLGQGYYVKTITPEKITLQHDELEIPVYFGHNDK